MVTAELGLNSGIQFQRFDHYAVGEQSVVDRGILDVVDVWGQAAQNYEVCFPQAGAIVFLDAATSPRSLVEVSSYTRDGYTCGAMNRAGTMVLVNGSGSAQSSNALAQAFIDSTTDAVSSAIVLDNCSVSSAHNLNLRRSPGARKSPSCRSIPAFRPARARSPGTKYASLQRMPTQMRLNPAPKRSKAGYPPGSLTLKATAHGRATMQTARRWHPAKLRRMTNSASLLSLGNWACRRTASAHAAIHFNTESPSQRGGFAVPAPLGYSLPALAL